MTRYAPRWFEEFEVGQAFETGGYTFTEAAIVDFAFRWDPQPFHLDKPHAEASVYGGLIASGFHTQLVAFRLVYQSGLFGHNRGGRGIDRLRWPRAVRPGETIRVRMKVARTQAARTTGQVDVDWEVVNQDDEPVLTATLLYVVAKRPAEA